MDRYYNRFETPLGILHCLIENEKISLLHPNPPLNLSPNSSKKHPIFRECQNQINAYFSRNLESFSLPLNLKGTSFMQNALNALSKIPFGKTISYGEFAYLIQHPKAHRAIGTALSKNPLLLLLPCHRVIRSDQKIGEYAWGKEKKEWLLRLEGMF